MPFFCFSRVPTIRRSASRGLHTPLLSVLLGLACLAPAGPAHAAAEIYSGLKIDLRDVSRLYDSLYRDRVTEELVDSTVTFDWRRIPLGNQRYRIKTFLPTDYSTTREVVDYTVLPGYRARFTVPRAAFFETTTRDVGAMTFAQPRDYSVPGLSIELTPVDSLASDLARASRAAVWADVVRQHLMLAPTPGETAQGGIKFDIPLPMPKSLESIFGPGEKTSLTVRGREEITIAGETRVIDPFIGVEGRENQSLFPSLDMQQKLDVTLTGTIGDKVSVQVDHSSEAIGDDANRVRLAYNGYEDEVIQLIELGNTSLSLPGSQLVSVSTGAQGLFGVKMLAKTGSTDFTLIASKQEGEVSSATFTPTGGSLGQAEARLIRDVDYVKNKYFYFIAPGSPYPGPDLTGIEVYRELTQLDNPAITRLPGLAVADPGDGSAIADTIAALNAGNVPAEQNYQLLTVGEDYDFIFNADDNSVIGIELFDPIPNTALKALAVVYRNTAGQPVGGGYAALGGTNPALPASYLVMRMLKSKDPKDRINDPTFDLMIRRFYNLGLTNIDGNSLKVDIEEINTTRLDPTRPDSSDVPYLRIFGLDQTDRTGTGKPDGLIDLTSGVVNVTTGLLQFPADHAFAPPAQAVAEWTDTSFAFIGSYLPQYQKSERIYNELLNTTEEQEVHQYVIRVSAVSTSKTFRINALNIVENSEVITIGGDRLTRDSDYTIDYETGEVTLRESALAKLTPNANVNIEYEFKPLGGLGSSTLAGISSVSKLGENARLGTTLLYESRATSDTKPRLGEEPSRGLVGGITASYEHQSRLLTDLANLLPFVDSDQPSTINLDGEVAGSLPNPNTKNEAYIEDFEGTEVSDRITLSRRSWYPASLPADTLGIAKPVDSRLGFIWYNIEPDKGGVHRKDLNPNLDDRENTLIQALDLELDAAPSPDDSLKYAGVMLGFPSGGLDITQGQFLEIWVNDFKGDDPSQEGGKLHIDLGILDENFFHMDRDEYDDEDKNRDGFAAAYDDTGLDGLFDNEEPGYSSANPDPNGDDIDLGRINGRLSKVNGTEANIAYDTEDLDRNGQMTRENAYFSYVIDLADTAEIDIRRQYPTYSGFTKAGHENDSWRLYRVKLTNHTVVSRGAITPRFDEIRHVRIWFEGADRVVRRDGKVGTNRLQITEFSIQGNRWEVDGVRDLAGAPAPGTVPTQFAIGTISTKTDPGVYQPPVNPNVKNEVADKESSLALRYQDLEQGYQVQVLKRFLATGQDLTLYRDLNFWVHTDQLRGGVEYYFRLGSNESNYYEIVVPFTAAYYNETGWSRVMIKMSDITGLKFVTTDTTFVAGTAPDVAEAGRAYPVRMVGAPSLQSVRFFYAGVRNVSNGAPQTGEIWMNDIYTGDVLRDFDHAERLSANIALAGGAFSVGGNWARTGADYRGLRQKRGAGADNSTLSLNARTDLQYFLPLGGFSIPLSVGYSRNKSLPKYPPNSDTEIVDAAVADSLRSESNTRSFGTSLSRRSASKNFLMRYTFDALRPTFSWSQSRSISPATRDTSSTTQGALTYSLNWTGQKTLPLFGKNRIRWWPNSFEVSTTGTRTAGQGWSYRNGEFRKNPYQYSATLQNRGSVRYIPFRSLETTFGMSVNRDVSIPHEWMGIDVGTEVGRSNNLRVSFVPPRGWIGISVFEPSVEVQSSYFEDSSPNVRRPGDPEGTLSARAQRGDTGRLRFDIGRHFGNLFRLVGVDVSKPARRGPAQEGGRAQPPVQSAPPDTAGGAGAPTAVPDTTRARPGAGTALRGLGRILTDIRAISANIQHQLSSSYARIPARPDLNYRLGIGTDTGIEGVDLPDQKREQLSFNLDSGVQLTEHLDVQGRYTRATTDTDTQTNRSRTLAVTWPDVQAKWDGLGEFRPLRPVLATGNLNVSYKETHQETGQRDQEPVTNNDTFAFSPALDMTFKNELQATLSVSYSSTANDTRGSKSETNTSSASIDFKKEFRGGGGIGMFGKTMSWNNNLETNLSIAYSKTGGERTTPGGLTEPIPSSNSFRVYPNARYTFSKNINGSAFIDYSRQYAEATRQTTTTVRVGVTAVVTF